MPENLQKTRELQKLFLASDGKVPVHLARGARDVMAYKYVLFWCVHNIINAQNWLKQSWYTFGNVTSSIYDHSWQNNARSDGYGRPLPCGLRNISDVFSFISLYLLTDINVSSLRLCFVFSPQGNDGTVHRWHGILGLSHVQDGLRNQIRRWILNEDWAGSETFATGIKSVRHFHLRHGSAKNNYLWQCTC